MDKKPSSAIASGEMDQNKDGLQAIQKSHDENEENLLSPKFEEPATSKKGNDAGHGNRFQSKLLMLYAMRAINSGYQFYLGTELVEMGDKFDDLIFKYKDQHDSTTGRYHYLQAKHKLNENDPKQKINGIQLIGTTKNKNFHLIKYFQSYVKIKSRGDDIEHCIICTNVDFDHFDLTKEGIELDILTKDNWPKILDCTIYKTRQAFYKFKVNNKLSNHLGVRSPMVNDFFDKLIFAVNTPNEDELDLILGKEVGKHFGLSNNTLPSAYIMNEMLNWFKKQDKQHYWLTADEANKNFLGKVEEVIALSDTTTLSIDYQNQLSKNLEFNDASIDQLLQELKSFWEISEKFMQISSKTPKLTATKVISAIKNLTEFFPHKDDYLVISSNRLKTNKKDLDMSLKVEICHRLLIVVDEDANPQLNVDCENLIPAKSEKKIILISNQNFKNKPYKDLIAHEHLTEETQKSIGKRQVLFQESDKTVNELIDLSKADKELDPQLIENLLLMADDKIQIPSFTSSNFQESLYIKRKVAFPSADELIKKLSRKMNCSIEELMGKCKVNSNGRIQWQVQDKKEKEKLWKNIEEILKEIESSDSSSIASIPEEKLIDPNNKKRVVLMGVAGTGKSTILSHYYNEIKRTNSDWWVIKISLVDHTSALRKIDSKDVSNFFINATKTELNLFACSLLKHRLETGDRIVIMLDGFDEIDTICQNKVVRLVNNMNESIPVYITTRPHMADELQFELSQLAYSLVKFTEEDQIKYVTSIWIDYLIKEIVNYDEVTVKTFAKELICKVSQTLKDKEKEFIGIPLQCRILAEYFQSKLITIKTPGDFSHLLDSQQFVLANLYKMMFEEKRRVYREEKLKVKSGDNPNVVESIDKSIRQTENQLRNLAITTIVDKQDCVDILIPSGRLKSEKEKKEEGKEVKEYGIKFGLLYGKFDGNKIQFLHRTYAEYLLADYIYNGFFPDQERHNKLLENESIRKWIIEEMLVKDKYNGVRVFFDSMLKDIINEEWKNRIKYHHNLPDRLQKFASLLCDQRIGKEWALSVAFDGRNGNTLLFIFDCLDVKLTPSDIRSVIENKIRNPFNQNTNVFQRILNYFNDADDKQLIEILEKLCKDNFWWRWSTALELKQENVKRNVEHFLDFMDSHREEVKFVFDYGRRISNSEYSEMPVFIMRHEDDDLMKKYFKLVSSVYSDDFDLTRFMKKTIRNCQEEKENWQIGRIEKTLIVLRDIGRINVATELSRFALLSYSKIFQQDENINFRLEEMGKMTGLYGMALRGDLNSIEKEIGCSLEKPENYSEDVKKSVLRLIMNANEDLIKDESENDTGRIMTFDFREVTPFDVAAAYGHEEICRKIFNFLQGMKGAKPKKLLNGAVYVHKNAVMVRTILKSVKAVWGQNVFIQLLKPVFRRDLDSTKSKKQIILETMFCVVVEEDQENGYRDLNELVFHSIQTLIHVPSCDILQGMIAAAGGLDHWVKRLMNTDIKRAFSVLKSKDFLDKLDQEHQIPKLIILITLRPSLNEEGTTSSYWLDYVKHESLHQAVYFIKFVSKRCGEEDLKRLLFARDENNILVVFPLLIWKGRDWLEIILSSLPGKSKQEIEELFEKETPQMVDYFFSSSTSLDTLVGREERLNAMKFYLENGNEKQLSKFSQVVDVRQLEETLRSEAQWRSGRERCKKIVELLEEKLDSKTKVIYNSLIEEYST